MQNNKTVFTTLAALVAGLLVGYLLWGIPKSNDVAINQGTHVMPDGTTMKNDGSDMSVMMMDMNASLRGKTGDDFDKAFISEMIVHHQGAIDMAKLALTGAKRQEIKDLSKAIISAQTNEITEMRNWQKEWYEVKR